MNNTTCTIVIQKLKNIVLELIKHHDTFTAFDVTLLARSNAKQGLGIHKDLKQITHEMFDPPDGVDRVMPLDYYRELRQFDVDGLTCEAWIYYHSNNDPAYYNPRYLSQAFHVAARQQEDVVLATTDIDTDDEDVNQAIEDLGNVIIISTVIRPVSKSERRLTLPITMLKTIGLESGTTAYLLFGDSDLVISATQPQDNANIQVLTVNADGRLRLSQKELANIDIEDRTRAQGTSSHSTFAMTLRSDKTIQVKI